MKGWKYHCAILGVPEDADLQEVSKAYRKLALHRHPDKHNNSQKSKEEFQQLSESYRYVATALATGHRHEAPLRSAYPAYHPVEPQSAPSDTPALRRKGEVRVQAQSNAGKIRPVWLHAAVACFALLVLSVFIERPVKQLPDYKPDSKDLFIKNWCFISHLENGTAVRDVSELWSQPACAERCSSQASVQEVSCAWNGHEFHATRTQPHLPPMHVAAVNDASLACEISFEKSAGTSSTPYRNQTEANCRTICEEMTRLRSADGIRCTWGGKEFLSQAMKTPGTGGIPVPDYAAIPKDAENHVQIKSGRAITSDVPPQIKLDADTGISFQNTGFRATCYMSVVSENGSTAEEFENETSGQCERHCMAQIAASPIGKEIKCSFAGKALITHVPDPMVSFMARDPSSTGFQQAGEFMASCQIFARFGEKRAHPKSDVTTEQACLAACKASYLTKPKGAEVACQFNGETIFQKTVGR